MVISSVNYNYNSHNLGYQSNPINKLMPHMLIKVKIHFKVDPSSGYILVYTKINYSNPGHRCKALT